MKNNQKVRFCNFMELWKEDIISFVKGLRRSSRLPLDTRVRNDYTDSWKSTFMAFYKGLSI